MDYDTSQEIQHERKMEAALEAYHARKEHLTEKAEEEVYCGEHDADLANDFDLSTLMRIARTFAMCNGDWILAASRLVNELDEVNEGMRAFAEDMAERWAA